MSRIASSRLLPRISALSFSTASPAAPAASSSPAAAGAAVAAAASDASSTSVDPASQPPPAARKSWAALKFTAFAAVSAALGTTGYVSYACSLEEVDQMTRELRKNSKRPIPEDVSGFEKFQAMAYSAAMKGSDQNTTLPSSSTTLLLTACWTPAICSVVPVAAIELYLDVRSQIEDQIRDFSEPVSDKLLPDLAPQDQHVFTLVLDLNETLVYSDWKDLSKLNRNPAQVIYVSGHALESSLQPENCVPIKPWKLENDDTQLLDLIPFLEFVAMARPSDIRTVLASYKGCDIASEFIERSKEHQR
ncbi:hypothetical protein PR202_ga09572 [Eleusine coracana subsp. coracana]|uniref:Mitochondrial import inner membrane translocase subunit TIM50 n=1 Tax=Eleusine coracana subsp. coracana TaxID=191504 RepID=A0AAV5C3G8_ELECO|nr:hypothetical protein PR202_ga09572 [Eleusine coracana subsp. coracana]